MTPFQKLVTYFRPYRKQLLIGVSCILLVNIVKLTGPAVLRFAVDDLKTGIDNFKLLRYGGLLVLISLVQGALLFTQRRLLINMSRDIEYDLRNDFYSHLQKMPMEFFQSHRTGDLMARATNDLSAVRMVAGPALMYSGNTVFATLLIVPVMASIDWRLTFLAFLSLPLVALATNYFSKQIHDRFEKVQEYFGSVSNRAQESLSGIRVMRAYAQEDAEIDSFKRVNRQYVTHNLALIKISSIFHPILQFFIGIGFIAVLWYGGSLTIQGRITIGQFVEFTLYLGYLSWPMIALGWVINIYQRGMASMGRMHQVMSAEPAIKDPKNPVAITQIQGEIEFCNLTFAYEGSPPTLADINLRVAPGQALALVGPVGSGKSTLMNLIPRLLDAPPGSVLIDGHPVVDVPLGLLRSSIGYVPQETFLFSETLADNIAFGVNTASREEIETAAEEAGIAEDIAGFTKGFDTIVGERGITLSGGQKQRMTIARAIMRRPRILILDDALSSVDTYTEEKILRHLRGIMRGRTCIISSHRISTVKDADLIVVLDQGRIVERGTHDELLAKRGFYAELYDKQLLEEELAAS
jgi:ATP-binding cassette subfamily B protein